MKVLILTQYIYDDTLPGFSKNKTGFGLMVNDIVKYISVRDEVSLLTRVITKGKHHNGYEVVRHTWKDIFCSLSLKYFLRGVKYACSFKQSVKDKLRYMYYYIDAGYVKKIIKQLKPDIIHIHGVGYITKSYIEVCQELKVPYIVTLHGLKGLNDSVLAPKNEKVLEKDFLIESEKRNIPVTVISNGMKKRILNNYGLLNGNNIREITNGTNIEIEENININIRRKYNIPVERKIILCIGNISIRKNQNQVIKSFLRLDKEQQKNTTILFLGNDLEGKLREEINELGLKNLIYCGFVDKREISSFWIKADLNVVASIDEGFGLSMIEGFVYGVPTVTFSDLDAIKDLYHEKAMLLVNERSDEALAQGMEKALNICWDREWIKEYSEQFSLDKMALKYHKLYSDILESFNK